MPTVYRLREVTRDEAEVKAAIAALEACHTPATQEAIQLFTELSRSRVINALRSLKVPLLVIQKPKRNTAR